MHSKQQILTLLKEEFNYWQELLASLNEAQIIAQDLPSSLSIKDTVAHLRAWQQRSIARLQAALLNSEPEFSGWPAELNTESDDDLEQVNAWIYETYLTQSWSEVYHDWREGFLRVLQLGESISEQDLLDEDRYPWLEGHPLISILMATYEHHHQDHLEPLVAWLKQNGNGRATK